MSDQRIIISPDKLPSQKIISFSHQSILIPPDDEHYGKHGKYRNCLHYQRNSAEFKRCQEGKSDWIGELTTENKDKGILQRLTWNPKFEEMIGEIDNFTDNLP